MYNDKSFPSYKKINLGGKVVPDKSNQYPGVNFKIALNAPALLRHFLRSHAHVNDDVSIELKLKRPKRSENQNNFYHVYLDLISLSSGHTIDELKSWVNESILGKGIKEVFGHTTRIVGHSSDLNMSEFCEMINEVEEQTGVPIPDPTPFNLLLTLDEYGKLREKQRDTYKKVKAKDFIHGNKK